MTSKDLKKANEIIREIETRRGFLNDLKLLDKFKEKYENVKLRICVQNDRLDIRISTDQDNDLIDSIRFLISNHNDKKIGDLENELKEL